MIEVFFLLVSLLGATVHVILSPPRRSSTVKVAETYLLYLLVIFVGLLGVLTAYAHVFRPVQTSATIGWSTSPYEYEVGMADLTVGLLGILCFWLRGEFWLATAIASAVWLLGDAIGHVRQLLLHNDHAAYNSGIFLYIEFIAPTMILGLALYSRHSSRQAR